jgi:methylmalonyl-CoA mutase
MKQTLDFKEFSNSNLEIWKKGVTKELGEKSYESLIWSFDDHLEIEPYYTENSDVLDVFAKTSTYWAIKESFEYKSPEILNKSILKSLEGGVNSIEIVLTNDAKVDFNLLFKNIFVQYIEVFFSGKYANANTISDYWKYCESLGLDVASLKGGLMSFANSNEVDNRVTLQKVRTTSFTFFSIDASPIQNMGGLASHSLIYAMIEGERLVQSLICKGQSVGEAIASIRFVFASEPSYFIEIAKLRAFRTMWATIVKTYDPQLDLTDKILIDTKSSAYYQSSVDRHNNLLRATTQSMSSIIGGTDSLEVIGFEQSLNKDTEEARRWARNIQHLLIEESYFNLLKDAAKGSYYIEEITTKLAEHTWTKFQYWHAKDVSLNESKEWTDELNNCQFELKKSIDNGSRVFLGVNKYPNKSETFSNEKATGNRLVSDFEKRLWEEKK